MSVLNNSPHKWVVPEMSNSHATFDGKGQYPADYKHPDNHGEFFPILRTEHHVITI